MKIYTVYENYCGELYEQEVFHDKEKADRYCEILNEPNEGDEYIVIEKESKYDNWTENDVTRYLTLYSSDVHDDGEFGMEECVIMKNPSEVDLSANDYYWDDKDDWHFQYMIKVESFDNYDIEQIKDEFFEKLEEFKKLHSEHQ